MSEWVIKFTGLPQTEDNEVHVVHISCVIIACTLESLSSLTQITHNLQAKINFKKKEQQKSEGTRYADLSLEMATLHQFTIPLILNYFPELRKSHICNNFPARRK